VRGGFTGRLQSIVTARARADDRGVILFLFLKEKKIFLCQNRLFRNKELLVEMNQYMLKLNLIKKLSIA